jgi:hypothetical protein
METYILLILSVAYILSSVYANNLKQPITTEVQADNHHL